MSMLEKIVVNTFHWTIPVMPVHQMPVKIIITK